MKQAIDSLSDGTQIRFEDEDTFVVLEGVSAISGQPDLVNVWVVGDKLPTRMRKGELIEVREGDAGGMGMDAEEELRRAELHKAEPLDATFHGEQPCRRCGRLAKRVPGGSGPVWVHADSGAVVGKDGPT